MNVSEMVKNVKAECHPATNIDGIIKRWLNQGQKYLASKAPKSGWPFLRQYGFSLTTTANVSTYALSCLVDTSKIINFYETSSPQFIDYISEREFRMRNPGPTSTGTPYLYRLKGFSPVQNQPTSASVLSIVSSSASDTTQEVTVQGIDSSNVYQVETISLTGTTPVSTSTSFLKVMGFSKNAKTIGKVTSTSNSGGVTNVVVSPNERSVTHPVVEFFSIPGSALTIYYDFTLKLQNIYNDDDISLFPETYHDAIELFAKQKCFKHMNNPSLATLTFQELESRINDMKNEIVSPAGVISMDSVGDDFSLVAGLPSNFPRGS